MSRHIHNLLCLGDSYTVGENVPLLESFPYQTVQRLRQKGIQVHAPEIVAKTGWTSFELGDYLINHTFCEQYDAVTLLIGVNNQYRGLHVQEYGDEFEFLLRKAIHFAGQKPESVIVFSIPDWGITPFAKDRDSKAISDDIDAYNFVNRAIAEKYGCHYIDITPLSKEVTTDPALLAADGLHPSGIMYEAWALKLCHILQKAWHS